MQELSQELHFLQFLQSESSCMARDLMPGNVTVRSIKTGDPRKRLGDGDGLYLRRSPRAVRTAGALTTL